MLEVECFALNLDWCSVSDLFSFFSYEDSVYKYHFYCSSYIDASLEASQLLFWSEMIL